MARITMHDRRDLLVDAALRVMDREGVAATTTRAVVGEAEMSLASFHYAFISRDEMMSQAIRRIVGGLDDQVPVEADLSAERPADVLIDQLQAMLDGLTADPGRAVLLTELTTATPRSPAIGPLGAELTAARRRVLVRWADAWARSCLMTWTSPVGLVASMVMAVLDGLVLQWLTDRDPVASRDALVPLAGSVLVLARPAVVPAP